MDRSFVALKRIVRRLDYLKAVLAECCSKAREVFNAGEGLGTCILKCNFGFVRAVLNNIEWSMTFCR